MRLRTTNRARSRSRIWRVARATMRSISRRSTGPRVAVVRQGTVNRPARLAPRSVAVQRRGFGETVDHPGRDLTLKTRSDTRGLTDRGRRTTRGEMMQTPFHAETGKNGRRVLSAGNRASRFEHCAASARRRPTHSGSSSTAEHESRPGEKKKKPASALSTVFRAKWRWNRSVMIHRRPNQERREIAAIELPISPHLGGERRPRACGVHRPCTRPSRGAQRGQRLIHTRRTRE